MSDQVRFKAERDLARQSTIHHVKRERQLERLLADFISLANPSCTCRTCAGLLALQAELSGD